MSSFTSYRAGLRRLTLCFGFGELNSFTWLLRALSPKTKKIAHRYCLLPLRFSYTAPWLKPHSALQLQATAGRAHWGSRMAVASAAATALAGTPRKKKDKDKRRKQEFPSKHSESKGSQAEATRGVCLHHVGALSPRVEPVARQRRHHFTARLALERREQGAVREGVVR